MIIAARQLCCCPLTFVRASCPETIDLSSNRLTSTIPSEIGSAISLGESMAKWNRISFFLRKGS